MGTNYYLIEDICGHCGRGGERLHIGKSSAGWCFSLQVLPEEHIESLADWERRWSQPNTKIVSEYGDEVSTAKMLETIRDRKWQGSKLDTRWFTQNDAEEGPNGLARQRLDGRHCVGHGDGTYDLITGDFS